MCRRGRGQQGRQSSAGPSAPPGLVQARQHNQHRNFSPAKLADANQPNGNALQDVPIGAKLQGFVDHVKEKFGFIRCECRQKSPYSESDFMKSFRLLAQMVH